MSDPATRIRSRATADLVARTANVSRVAVSRAFNPHASIKLEKRDLILKVAQELNYTPNMAARSMVTGRSHLVGIIVPDISGPWESQELDAMTTALQAEGFATLLFRTRDDLSLDETLLTYMKGFNPDSVIAYAENVRPATLARVLDRAVPIYIAYPDGEEGEAEAAPLFDRLDVMQRDGIEQAVALMQGYGARTFAYLAGKTGSLATASREHMVRKVLSERGLPPPIRIQGDYTYDTAYRETRNQFSVGEPVDAIFAANDVGAFGAIDALRHELGLRVPQDVKVVGFDDILQSHWKSYNLTTVHLDLHERTQALLRLILRRLKNPASPSLTETVPTRLIVRGTVG
ncbi:MAG: substrate-binding domain-containing protein [Devosia sp.]|nr:substrate-binding domain-containing protein [Devosia sp.]